MRMVLVIGSEGISLMLGYLPKCVIWCYYKNINKYIIDILSKIKFKNKVIISLIFGPNHSIRSVWICWSYWKKPNTTICPKYLSEIFISTHIIYIRTCVWIPLSFQIIKSWRVGKYKFTVKPEKHGNHNEKCYLHQYSYSS